MVYLVPSLILIAGIVDDLLTKKIHNWLVIIAAITALAATYIQFDTFGLSHAFIAFGLATILMLPLVIVKIIGAGDMKLFMAFALAVDTTAVFNVFIYSMAWGALLGVVSILLKKDGMKLLSNIGRIIRMQKPDSIELHKIPFSVALGFGWMSHISLMLSSGGMS